MLIPSEWPITFGWNMTIAMLLLLHACFKEKKSAFLCYVAIFFIAVLSDFSKGPLIASVLGIVFMLAGIN